MKVLFLINNIYKELHSLLMPSGNPHHDLKATCSNPPNSFRVKFPTSISTADLEFPPPRTHRLVKFRARVMPAGVLYIWSVHNNEQSDIFLFLYFCFVFLAYTCGQSFRSTYRRSQTARKIFLQESNPWKMWEGLIELIKLTYSCVVETLWFSLTEHQVESLVILMGLAPLFVRRWCS